MPATPEKNVSLTTAIRALLDFIKVRNAKGGAIRSSSPEGQQALQKMRVIAQAIAAGLELNEKSKFTTRISKGISNMPTILWVAVVPKGYEVSNCVSVTICFGKDGEGIVAGLMESSFLPSARGIPVDRRKLGVKVDVDGKKPGMRYNNRFLMPLELVEAEISDDKLISHLQKSLLELQTNYMR